MFCSTIMRFYHCVVKKEILARVLSASLNLFLYSDNKLRGYFWSQYSIPLPLWYRYRYWGTTWSESTPASAASEAAVCDVCERSLWGLVSSIGRWHDVRTCVGWWLSRCRRRERASKLKGDRTLTTHKYNAAALRDRLRRLSCAVHEIIVVSLLISWTAQILFNS